MGYYRKPGSRVGYGGRTDFFTSSSSGPVFGELVCAASARLLRSAGRDPGRHSFIEVGAEPGHSVLAGVDHPFAHARTLRVGAPLDLADDCVVFSNELFDAQPCVRTVFRQGRWWEIGVQVVDGTLVEVLLSCERERLGEEDYHFDEPRAAADLAERLAAQPWRGLFLAFDYGKMLAELLESTPGGTARAYYRHTQSNDLLARPGEQDLTCHICWDWLMTALRNRGFAEPRLESQEAFLVRHAGDYIAAASAADALRLSPRKLALLQLLHPSHLGQKFQVLHALR